MISQLPHDASANLTQNQIVAANKRLKTNFNGNAGIDKIYNGIALVNLIALNYQTMHLNKNVLIIATRALENWNH
ncbi:MAG: hypothetical protein H7Z70_05755 [Bacteroidia bacterium]|nr:hypothetical protein [Methylotenera sp.]